MKIQKSLNVVALAFFSSACGSANKNDFKKTNSQTDSIIAINDRSEIRLGDGVNITTEERFPSCVKFDPSSVVPEDASTVDPATLSSTNLGFNVRQITSFKDVDELTSTSVSGGVRGIYGSGSFSYSQDNIFKLGSDNASVGIRGIADYGRWYLKKIELTEDMKALASVNIDEFYRRCGHEVVTGYRLGQGINVLLSTSQQSSYSYEKISASLSAAVNTGTVAGDLNSSFLNVAQELTKLGVLQISIRAFGGGPLKTFSEIIKSPSDIGALKDKISRIMSEMTPEKAIKTFYLTSKYQLPLEIKRDPYDKLLAEHQKKTIEDLYADYRLLISNQTRLKEIAQQSSLMLVQWKSLCTPTENVEIPQGGCAQYLASLTQRQQKISEAIGEIDRLAQNCSKAKTLAECKTLDPGKYLAADLVLVTWPKQFLELVRIAKLKAIQAR